MERQKDCYCKYVSMSVIEIGGVVEIEIEGEARRERVW